MMLLRARSLAMGRSGARPVLVDLQLALLNAGITPVVPEHGSLGASGDLAPLAHCALALIGEGEVVGRRGRRRSDAGGAGRRRPRAAHAAGQGGSRADQRHRRHARHARARARRPRRRWLGCADVTAAMSVEGLLGTDRAFAADLQALRPQPGQAVSAAQPAPPARRLGDRGQPPPRRPAGAGRLLAALHAAGARRGARHDRPRPHGRRARARRGDRQPDGPARRPGRVVRQLPRRAARLRLRLPRHRRRPSVAPSPSAAPTACSTPARSHGLPPFLAHRRRRQLRADDRPLHAGRDGDREPSAWRCRPASTRCRPPRCRRTTSRRAGRRPASCAARSPTCGACWPSSWCAPRAAIDLRAPLRPGSRHRCGAAPCCAAVVAGPGPDRWLSPDCSPRRGPAEGRCWRPSALRSARSRRCDGAGPDRTTRRGEAPR